MRTFFSLISKIKVDHKCFICCLNVKLTLLKSYLLKTLEYAQNVRNESEDYIFNLDDSNGNARHHRHRTEIERT